ncbi:hypothetical protein NM208_g2635 [Fusarium decemcellulare]|uniref:Uncharacterized protein n=1 Tax=Fusarium decemcellulare TaxID=57161 RepID=A0ACC1SRU9_9HYPO|nr:hypothetical protein NM208_g2635 [Fusarium decemcellulare]
MSLEDVFPEDPWLPSLRYAASSLIPFNLPWATQEITVGTGFHSKLAQSADPFAPESAFDRRAAQSVRLRYRSESNGTYTHAESSFGSHSLDHMDFSLAASADVAIVNVSGQARFEQNASKNSDGIRSALSGKLFAGYLEWENPVSFSQDARDALKRARTSDKDVFEEKYGDYYVSAMRVGAANGTELSAGSSSEYSSESSSYSMTVKVQVFCWEASATTSGSSFESSSKLSGNITYNGYDTLSRSQSGTKGSEYGKILGEANKNLEKGKLLQGRLKDTVAEFGLSDGCFVSQEKARTMLQSGSIVEIQLLPSHQGGLDEILELRRLASQTRRMTKFLIKTQNGLRLLGK